MRCQLCDGPVVGGRCKNCGMPYKNDAILYHVNEDRKTHDRHASEKAREELRKRLDSSETAKKAQQTRTQSKTARNSTRNQSAYRPQKQKNPAKVKSSSVTEKRNPLSSEPKKKKKHQGIFMVLMLLIILLPVIRGVWDTWRSNILDDVLEHYAYEPDTEEDLPVDTEINIDTEYTAEVSDDYYLVSWTNSASGNVEYALSAGHGQTFVGTEIEPGQYTVYTNEENVKLVQEGVGGKEIHLLKTGEEAELTLNEGDVLYLDEYENSYDSVYLRKTE